MALSPACSRRRLAFLALLFIVAGAILFWPVTRFGFLNYDDNFYVTANSHVRAGLTREGLSWALTSLEATNWHPLTWLSHMLDVEMFGLDPGGHHLASILIHGLNAALLFLLLAGLTGTVWPGALAAALFLVHPLHVEPVVWISQRKEVLATLFGLLSLLAYLRYTRKPGFGRYLAVAVPFAFGLMSKSVLTTLPVLFLLLDGWPLGRCLGPARRRICCPRFPGRQAPRDSPADGGHQASLLPGALALIREKLPLLGLSMVSSALTYQAQLRGGAVRTLSEYSLPVRLANALNAYAGYLKMTIWPLGLCVLYPHPSTGALTWWRAADGLALAMITIAAFLAGRRLPWAVTGWLWYLVALLPVIGLVQVGNQAMADRYTYLPLTGIFILVSWSIRKPGSGKGALVKAACAAAGILLLTMLARRQIGVWRTDVSLFRHAVGVTRENFIAYNQLGVSLVAEGRNAEAFEAFAGSIRSNGEFFDAYYNMGLLMEKLNRIPEAIGYYREALEISPDFWPAHNNLGLILLGQGMEQEAAEHFRLAFRANPSHPAVRANFQNVLHRFSRPGAAGPIQSPPSP